MPLVYNPTKELVSTKMQGAWFTFKPEMKKSMDADKCRYIEEARKETGLVILPNEFDPQSEHYVEGYDKTPEGLAKLEECRLQGISNLLAHHYAIMKNNQVSLRRDMAHKYPDGDSKRLTALEMSSGELESLKLVAKYQQFKQDGANTKLQEINKLLENIGPISEG